MLRIDTMRFVKLLHIFLLVMLVFSCKKKIKDHPIPSVPFSVTIDLTLPSYSDLNGAGGWAYASGGIKGILIYRISADAFVVWERQSPEDPDNTCANGLTPNDPNFLELTDPCSGAVFSMYDGSPISGSEWGLRQYRTYWDGSNILKVYN